MKTGVDRVRGSSWLPRVEPGGGTPTIGLLGYRGRLAGRAVAMQIKLDAPIRRTARNRGVGGDWIRSAVTFSGLQLV